MITLHFQDYYRRIYFEAIDLTVNAIDQRFDQPRFDTYAKMESLLIKVHLTPKFFFGRDETVQHSHKEFYNFISIWYF